MIIRLGLAINFIFTSALTTKTFRAENKSQELSKVSLCIQSTTSK